MSGPAVTASRGPFQKKGRGGNRRAMVGRALRIILRYRTSPNMIRFFNDAAWAPRCGFFSGVYVLLNLRGYFSMF